MVTWRAMITGYLVACLTTGLGWFAAMLLVGAVSLVADPKFATKTDELLQIPMMLGLTVPLFSVATFVLALPGYVVVRSALAVLGWRHTAAFAGAGALNGLAVSFGLIGLSTSGLATFLTGPACVIVAIGALAGAAASLTERRFGVWERQPPRQPLSTELRQ